MTGMVELVVSKLLFHSRISTLLSSCSTFTGGTNHHCTLNSASVVGVMTMSVALHCLAGPWGGALHMAYHIFGTSSNSKQAKRAMLISAVSGIGHWIHTLKRKQAKA